VWSGEPGRCVLIEFADREIDLLTHGEIGSLKLPNIHELFDDRISSITLQLAHEALQGLPSGKLYAQGLSLALLGRLAHRYATHRSKASLMTAGTLGPKQKRRIVELIRADLGDDLSLRRLADAVGLSAFHFARTFKTTFGTSPHRYIQAQRVESAAQALKVSPERPIAEIALEHGFSSQSHMTELMRRRLGRTPREVRDAFSQGTEETQH
jgi:AraC family transcriptional regulator